MAYRLVVLLIASVCLGFTGCGESEDDAPSGASTQDAPSAESDQDAKGADADAKADARELVTNVEACFAGSQDYSMCDAADELGDIELELGSGSGQVEVADATATAYTVNAKSSSGNVFTIEKGDDGTLARTCTTAGSGGCKEGGKW